MLQKQNIFWSLPTNTNHSTPVINPLNYIGWLIERGYRVLEVGGNPILGKINLENKTVTIVDGPEEIHQETLLYFKNTSDNHFQKGGKYYVSDDRDKKSASKDDVLTSWFWNGKRITERVYSDNLNLINLHKGDFLHDNKNEVYFNFNNGIVKVTKDKIELLPNTKLNGLYRYNTDIISNLPDMKGFSGNIDLSACNEKSKFEQFCELATSKRKSEKIDGKPEIGVNYYHSQEDMNTLKSAIGYMLSDHKEGGASKMVLFQDRYLDNVSRQGGNGKTLVVNSIMKLRKGVKISANRVNLKQDKFVFQEVNLGDKIIFFDEVTSQYFIGELFNEINNFLPVQKKYENQFRLEGQDLPKMVACSNYMVWKPQETSQSRRIYCVEFSDFFKSATENGYRLEDFFNGKFIFDDMNETEWNSFFKFMFESVQFYLQNGFYTHPNPYYSNQNLLLTMKQYWDMDKMEWVKNYLTTTRVESGHFLSVDKAPLRVDLYDKFCSDLSLNDYDTRKFDEEKFGKMFYQVSKLLGYEYNPTQAHRGMSMNSRKITRKGKSGSSYYVTHIVHPKDADIDLSSIKEDENENTNNTNLPLFGKKVQLVSELG
jgi:hypothetical protein